MAHEEHCTEEHTFSNNNIFVMVNMLFIVISKICPLRITFLTLISTENYILLTREFTILILSYTYLIFPYNYYDSTNQIKLKDIHTTIKRHKNIKYCPTLFSTTIQDLSWQHIWLSVIIYINQNLPTIVNLWATLFSNCGPFYLQIGTQW